MICCSEQLSGQGHEWIFWRMWSFMVAASGCGAEAGGLYPWGGSALFYLLKWLAVPCARLFQELVPPLLRHHPGLSHGLLAGGLTSPKCERQHERQMKQWAAPPKP